mgnify:CR=1 FL=1
MAEFYGHGNDTYEFTHIASKSDSATVLKELRRYLTARKTKPLHQHEHVDDNVARQKGAVDEPC